MKTYNFNPILIIMLFSIMTLESNAQIYQKIDYPYVGENKSTVDYVCIKAITFTEYSTIINFITCYTGHYILLSEPNHKNAMYIRMKNKKYKLKLTTGIASNDGITYCQPGQLLEFSAVFEPIPVKERANFDLIEGLDGDWNFYNVSISKYLAGTRIPDLQTLGQRNLDKVKFKPKTIEYPYVERQSHPYLIMMKIDRLTERTIIHFWYKNPYKNSSLNLNKNTYLQTLDGKKYYVQSSIGIPLSPKVYQFKDIGQSATFSLTFPALPNDIDCFSLYESKSNGFTFYNVKLHSDYNEYLIKYKEMEKYFKSITSNTTTNNVKNTVRRKLKKDPNFKID